MSQKTRIWIVVAGLVVVAAVLAGVGFLSQNQATQAPATTPQPGMIHLYVNGSFAANLLPAEMQKLPAASFVDKEQGKTQKGYWLRDVLQLYVKENALSPSTQITFTGSRQGTEKSATVTWAETLDPANHILFSPSNDGTSVKIAATMDKLATRDNWIQGLTQIGVQTK
ncbi:MAG: hypothetical protein M1570_09055 [Chloroflexi bacterium]|nr:hypothetical protein [Chloroflexota bacterium]